MRLIFNDEMIDFLVFSARESIISQILLNGDSTHLIFEGNYIKRVDSEIDSVSFLPVSKIEKVEDVWNKQRMKIKIGRFIRKFFTEFTINQFSINDKEIEKFVNLYKSFFSRDTSKLKIVSGDEILKYYLEDNYHSVNGNKVGTLWNSCMRQRERNKFMKIYATNPSVKMLVFFSDDDKVRARALLWEEVNNHKEEDKKIKFMDRIYYIYDHDVNFFKDWAKENGYITKWEQSAKTEMMFDTGEGRPVNMSLYVNLDTKGIFQFPYFDTFKYYNEYKNRFSNSTRYGFDYTLIQSNGAVEREPEPEEYDDEN